MRDVVCDAVFVFLYMWCWMCDVVCVMLYVWCCMCEVACVIFNVWWYMNNMPTRTSSDIMFVHAINYSSMMDRKDHITPVVYSLHWFRVKERIEFTLLSLVYQCVHDMAPAYLSELLQLYVPSRTLRSSNQHQLAVSSWKTKSFGCRTFTFCAASYWNSLPLEIRLAP